MGSGGRVSQEKSRRLQAADLAGPDPWPPRTRVAAYQPRHRQITACCSAVLLQRPQRIDRSRVGSKRQARKPRAGETAGSLDHADQQASASWVVTGLPPEVQGQTGAATAAPACRWRTRIAAAAARTARLSWSDVALTNRLRSNVERRRTLAWAACGKRLKRGAHGRSAAWMALRVTARRAQRLGTMVQPDRPRRQYLRVLALLPGEPGPVGAPSTGCTGCAGCQTHPAPDGAAQMLCDTVPPAMAARNCGRVFSRCMHAPRWEPDATPTAIGERAVDLKWS